MDLSKLQEPTRPDEINWRIQRAGVKNGRTWAKAVPYPDNRAIQNRLDAVCGPENWRNEFKEWSGGQLCGISIRVEREWVTKWDGAPNTEFEPLKGGLSDAMKRAGVQWGMFRDMYLMSEEFVEIAEKGTPGAKYQKASKDGKTPAFHWLSPNHGKAPKAQNEESPGAQDSEEPRRELPSGDYPGINTVPAADRDAVRVWLGLITDAMTEKELDGIAETLKIKLPGKETARSFVRGAIAVRREELELPF